MRIVSNSHHTCHKGFCDWGASPPRTSLPLSPRRRSTLTHSHASRSLQLGLLPQRQQVPQECLAAGQDHDGRVVLVDQAGLDLQHNQLAATSNNALTASGVNKFLGTNTGAIASWFHTNSAQDSTNGHSWVSPIFLLQPLARAHTGSLTLPCSPCSAGSRTTTTLPALPSR